MVKIVLRESQVVMLTFGGRQVWQAKDGFEWVGDCVLTQNSSFTVGQSGLNYYVFETAKIQHIDEQGVPWRDRIGVNQDDYDIWRAHARGCFERAGFTVLEMEDYPNQYCSEICCVSRPWLHVRTDLGTIDVGWRKRVIHLEWNDVNALKAERLFGESRKGISMDDFWIHCWDYQQLEENLRVLRGEARGEDGPAETLRRVVRDRDEARDDAKRERERHASAFAASVEAEDELDDLQSRLMAAEAKRDAYQRECDSRRVSYDALREALADRDRQLGEARELLAWFVDEAESLLGGHFIAVHLGDGKRFRCNGIAEEKCNQLRAKIDAYRVAYRAATGDK